MKSKQNGGRKKKPKKQHSRARRQVQTRAPAYSPHSADTAGGKSPGRNGGSLLHEASNREPEAVAERVLVNEQVAAALEIGVGVVPLVRRQSGGENHRRG